MAPCYGFSYHISTKFYIICCHCPLYVIEFCERKIGTSDTFLLLLSSSTVRHTQTQSNSIKFSLSSLSAQSLCGGKVDGWIFSSKRQCYQYYVEKFNNKNENFKDKSQLKYIIKRNAKMVRMYNSTIKGNKSNLKKHNLI